MRTDVIFEVGNFVPPRKNFDNPQEGRVYTDEGLSPTIRTCAPYWIVCYYED